MADSFQIDGLAAVQRKLEGMKVDVARKAGRAAATKAMRIVRDAAKRNAKSVDDAKTSEQIAKNIAVTGRYDRRQNAIIAKVGVRGGARSFANTKSNVRAGRAGKSYKTGGSSGNPGGDTWYWRLLEFGTSKMAARPFMRPALEQNVEKVVATFVSEMSAAVDRFAARAK